MTSDIRLALRRLWQNVRHDGASMGLNLAVLCVAFFTVTIVGVGVTNIGRISRSIEDRYQVTVYLRDGVSDARIAEVAAGIGQVDGVRSVTHVTPSEFRSRFLAAAGDGADGMEQVALDVFPSVLEVQLLPDFRDRMDLDDVAARISQVDAVEGVDTHEAWMGKLKGLVGVLGVVALVFGLTVLAGSVLILANTVKLSLIKRRRVVEVMRLFGATQGFIEAPVLLEGLLQGLVASLAAVLIGWAAVAAVDARIGALAGGGSWHVAFVPPEWIAVLVAACGLVGLLGAHLASVRALRV